MSDDTFIRDADSPQLDNVVNEDFGKTWDRSRVGTILAGLVICVLAMVLLLWHGRLSMSAKIV